MPLDQPTEILPLARAQKLADRIAAELTPFCDAIEIAGSIRRRRPICNDIDLVCLPKRGQTNALINRCSRHATLVRGDRVNLIFNLGQPGQPKIQLDLFLAAHREEDMFHVKPGNFGTLLLCRTGSKEHNIWLIQVAKSRGLTWNPYYGVYDPHLGLVASETEADIFRALSLDFIPPESREK